MLSPLLKYLGEKFAGTISDEDFQGVVENACPGPGACGGMYTANTMASAIEALGMSLPYNSSNPAISDDKQKEMLTIGEAMNNLLDKEYTTEGYPHQGSF